MRNEHPNDYCRHYHAGFLQRVWIEKDIVPFGLGLLGDAHCKRKHYAVAKDERQPGEKQG